MVSHLHLAETTKEGVPCPVKAAVQDIAATAAGKMRGFSTEEQRAFWVHIRDLAGHHISVIDLAGYAAQAAAACVLAHALLERMGLAW